MKRFLSVLVLTYVMPVFGMDTLFVTKDKLSTVVFDEPITMVDVGTKNIFLFYEVRNEKYLVLQEMKAVVSFVPTNCVVTTEKKIYEFIVISDDSRSSYVFDKTFLPSILDGQQAAKANVLKTDTFKTQDTFHSVVLSDSILLKKSPNIIGLSTILNGVGVELNKHYIKENSLIDNIVVQNKSNVDIDIEYVKYFVSSSSGDEELVKKQWMPITHLKAGQVMNILVMYDYVSIHKNKHLKVLVGLKNNENEVALLMRSRIFNNPSKVH